MPQYSNTWAALCVAVYVSCLLTLGLETNVLGPLLSAIAAKLGVDEATLGPIYTISGFLTMMGAIPAGLLIDRFPGHYVVGFAILSQAIGVWFLPYCTKLWQVLAVYAIPSCTFNFINIGGNTLGAWVKPHNAAPYLNLIGSGFGIGSFLAPFLAYQCGQMFGDALVALKICAAIAFLVSVALLLLPSPPRGGVDLVAASPRANPNRLDEEAPRDSYSDLTKPLIEAENAAREPPQTAWTPEEDNGEATIRLPKVSWHLVFACASIVGFNTGTTTGLGAWIHTWGIREARLSAAAASSANSLYWGAFALGRVASALAATKLQPIAIVVPCLSLCVLGLLTLSVLSAVCYSHPVVLFGALFCVGFGSAPVFSNSFALLARYSRVTGAASSVISGASGCGIMIIPAFMAFGVDSHWLNPQPGTYKVVMSISVFLIGIQIALSIWAELIGRFTYYKALQEGLEPANLTAASDAQNGLPGETSEPGSSLPTSAATPTPAVGVPTAQGAGASPSSRPGSLSSSFVAALGTSPATLLSISGETPQAVQVRAAKLGGLYS